MAMIVSIRSIRKVRTTGRNNRSVIVSIEPEIARQTGICNGTRVIQELMRDGSIKIKAISG